MKIINHRLCKDDGTPYPYKESPNKGARLQAKYLVMHFTAGGSCRSSLDWLCNPDADASAHLLICRDGSITQLVPFDTIAWHAGRSLWQGLDGMNKYSIGIEMDNVGAVTRDTDGWHAWFHKPPYPNPKFPPFPEDQVLVNTPHKFYPDMKNWQRYSKEQLDVALEIAVLLVNTYKLKDILGHEDITRKTSRKTDPGPAFPMELFRAKAYPSTDTPEVVVPESTAAVSAIYTVVVDSLNIRSGPNKEYDTIGKPLTRGTRVQVLETSDENPRWKKVDVLSDDRLGWVNSDPLSGPPTLQKSS